MVKCVVPNCKSGYASSTKRSSLFKIPPESLTEWSRKIGRVDRPLTLKDHVCEEHFMQEDVIREECTELYTYKLKKPRLAKGAVPCIFPQYLSNCQEKSDDMYTIIKVEESSPAPSPVLSHDPLSYPEDPNFSNNSCHESEVMYTTIKLEEPSPALNPFLPCNKSQSEDNPIGSISSYKSIFTKICNNELFPTLPSKLWMIRDCKDHKNTSLNMINIFKLVIIEHRHKIWENRSGIQVIEKQISLFRDYVKCFVFNSLIDHETLFGSGSEGINTLDQLENFVKSFDELPVCYGGISITQCPENFKSDLYKIDMMSCSLRHKECGYIMDITSNFKKECTFCRRSRVYVRVFKTRSGQIEIDQIQEIRKKNNMKKRHQRLKAKLARVEDELRNLKEKIKMGKEEDLLNKFE